MSAPTPLHTEVLAANSADVAAFGDKGKLALPPARAAAFVVRRREIPRASATCVSAALSQARHRPAPARPPLTAGVHGCVSEAASDRASA